MFRITRKVDLGMVAVAHLARKDREAPPGGVPVTSARELAETYGIPPFLVSNILKALANRGIIASVRGAHGGYVLRRRPNEISLQTLIEALEGPLKMADCCGETSPLEASTHHREVGCSVAPNCPTSSALRAVEARIRLLLESVTFDQILDDRFACPDPVPLDAALPPVPESAAAGRPRMPSRNRVSVASLMSSLPIHEERP